MTTDAALALAATAAAWRPVQAFRIPSRTRANLHYIVTSDGYCSCRAFAVGGFTSCDHTAAVQLLAAVVPDPCSDLELTRLPDDSWAWSRPAR